MDKFVSLITEAATGAGLKLLLAIVILIVGLWLSKKIVKIMEKGKGFNKLDLSIQSFLKSFLKVVLYAAVFASAAICIGIPQATFLTLFTSAGVAIGLALQGALSNFAGGLLILIFKPFKVGDFIENGSIMGTVTHITVIYTVLQTVDNKVITIPNGTLTNSNITDYSTNPTRRVDLTVSASYDADVETVKKLLLEVAEKHELILKDPAPFVRLSKHGSSSLDYTFRVWTKTEDYWTVYFDCVEEIREVFLKNNIEIPYNKLDVNVLSNK